MIRIWLKSYKCNRDSALPTHIFLKNNIYNFSYLNFCFFWLNLLKYISLSNSILNIWACILYVLPPLFHFTGNSFLVFYKSINLRMVGHEEYWFFKESLRGTGMGLILAACCRIEQWWKSSSTTHRNLMESDLGCLRPLSLCCFCSF